MSCKNCTPNNVDIVCKVCELVDKDLTAKKVVYCSFCDAYICISCTTDIVKRGKAALINLRLKL